MRRLIFALVIGLAVGTAAGCILPIYATDPALRTQELIYTSEDLRTLIPQWERIWFLDMPSHMTPFRVHGGLI